MRKEENRGKTPKAKISYFPFSLMFVFPSQLSALSLYSDKAFLPENDKHLMGGLFGG